MVVRLANIEPHASFYVDVYNEIKYQLESFNYL